MDPMQNPQVQQMIAALVNQNSPAAGQAQPPNFAAMQAPYATQQTGSLGNGAPPPPAFGMLGQAPPMTPPPAPIY